MYVVGVAGCAGKGDASLCVMAAGRLLTEVATAVSPGEEKEDEDRVEKWIESSASLLCRLWVS